MKKAGKRLLFLLFKFNIFFVILFFNIMNTSAKSVYRRVDFVCLPKRDQLIHRSPLFFVQRFHKVMKKHKIFCVIVQHVFIILEKKRF